jgi:lysophospholipase L1-like esterase
MKKTLILILIAGMTFFYACTPDQPSAPTLNVLKNDITIAAVGNSLTAGFQSSGLMEDFQMNSYPYLIAQQMDNSKFEQPIIGAPGIGSPAGMTPLYLDQDGNITQDSLLVDPIFLLKNALLPRPYDNLGIPGADLYDLLNTIDGSGGNPFFDMILRNPTLLNTTQLQQVALLQPTVLLLWAGNNDVLGAALDGGDLDQITSQSDFDTRMESILTQLQNDLPKTEIIMANIPYVTDIPYINTLDGVFLGGIPMVFDETLQPVDFGGGTYLPLITSETTVEHITLVGLGAYQQGLGIPDSAYMVDNLGLRQGQADTLEAGMIAAGLIPTGLPLDGSMTLTSAESSTIKDAVDGFNQTIASLAGTYSVQTIDANALLTELNVNGIDGATGKFVMVDPATTAFSLDGVHPNNAGYAIVANAFIDKINDVLQLEPKIPEVDVSSKLGQYRPPSLEMEIGKVINNVRVLFSRKNVR